MTIDEAHRILSNGLVNTPSEHEWCVAFKMAIDTMRKYQKIEPKIKVLQHFTEDTPLATQRMIKIINEIREVIEDGNK